MRERAAAQTEGAADEATSEKGGHIRQESRTNAEMPMNSRSSSCICDLFVQ